MPTVFPFRRRPMKGDHEPVRMLRSADATPRSVFSMCPSVSSATASVVASGVFTTVIPRSCAAVRSTLSSPVPTRAITRRSAARARTLRVNGSRPAIKPTTPAERNSEISCSVSLRPWGLNVGERCDRCSPPAMSKFSGSNREVEMKIGIMLNVGNMLNPLRHHSRSSLALVRDCCAPHRAR